ncbi:hypothetical protein HZS_4984 [Henneguya salminicola]|nr:hypothetical protein HZS_4984 [Henneguya salminicola]
MRVFLYPQLDAFLRISLLTLDKKLDFGDHNCLGELKKGMFVIDITELPIIHLRCMEAPDP